MDPLYLVSLLCLYCSACSAALNYLLHLLRLSAAESAMGHTSSSRHVLTMDISAYTTSNEADAQSEPHAFADQSHRPAAEGN